MAFLIFSLLSWSATDMTQNEFIVWNIGQGQWATWVQKDSCLHFDVGGERDATSLVKKVCDKKMNYIFLSHWDWDHIGLIVKLKKSHLPLCLAWAPDGKASLSKHQLLQGLSTCAEFPKQNVEKIFSQKNLQLDSNHLSHVVFLKNLKVIIPGDSTTLEEKVWKDRVEKNTQGILLGHHGSRTSTSSALLDKLPNLKWAVSSARQRRYGHPSLEVVLRLKERKIPLLRTEDWGNLHFQD